MKSLTDKYKDDIIQLDKSGLKPPAIQQKLIENHPEADDIPSIPTIYRIRNKPVEGNGNKYHREHYQHHTWDIAELNREYEKFIGECIRYCQPQHRKELNNSIRGFRKEFNDFFSAYEQKVEQVEGFIEYWGNEIIGGICDKCKSLVIDKTYEIIDKS